MSNTKYELLKGDTLEVEGETLCRIRATRNFANVRVGDLGGYLESESNLSHRGSAWVFGDAKVSGNAWVFGDAKVSGDAYVTG